MKRFDPQPATLLPRLSLDEWDLHYEELRRSGLQEEQYGGPLRRHVGEGDFRLLKLEFDGSSAALRLWNFLLSEETRLAEARAAGKKIVGVMKDLGTIPAMAYALPNVTAFYPDGAWWIPCIMELSSRDLAVADSLGFDESFCPVRAMLGAFVNGDHFPIPDLLVCSVGATCDDFSAIAQRLNGLGFPILWWEIPHRPDAKGAEVRDALGFIASELRRVQMALETLSGNRLSDDQLRAGIRKANEARRVLGELRDLAYGHDLAPLPALEMLIAEMLIIHFCSDREECIRVLEDLRNEASARLTKCQTVCDVDAVRVYWANPVADLRVMNMLESCGARICGTDYMFTHALDPIDENPAPMEALARAALADPMAGTAAERAERICREIIRFRAEAVVVSRIPGASHCATEGAIIREIVQSRLGIPVQEIEVPPVADALMPSLRTRVEALIELAMERRKQWHTQ